MEKLNKFTYEFIKKHGLGVFYLNYITTEKNNYFTREEIEELGKYKFNPLDNFRHYNLLEELKRRSKINSLQKKYEEDNR